MKIKYRSGYKYQLTEDYSIATPFIRAEQWSNGFLTLAKDGSLTMHTGYAWDGPSGPAIDTECFMRGSLVHDALYQLIQEGALQKTARWAADNILHALCLEDGMPVWRAAYVLAAVRMFGENYLGESDVANTL